MKGNILIALLIFLTAFVLSYFFNPNYRQNSHNDGQILGVFDNQGSKYRGQIGAGGGGGDSTPPISQVTDLSSYYNNSSFTSSISGTASDASGIASVDLRISRNSDNYYWNQSGMSWQTSAVWNSSSGTTSWSWSTSYLANNLGDGVAYTVNSRATDASTNSNQESDVTDDDSQEVFSYDISGPTTPSTLNDGTDSDSDSTTSTSQLSANWSAATDSVSGLAKYQYAIGTTSGATDVVSWTDNSTNTSVTKTGLSLTNGQTYYFLVRAVDNLDNIGSAKNSDGIKVEVTSTDSTISPTPTATSTATSSPNISTNTVNNSSNNNADLSSQTSTAAVTADANQGDNQTTSNSTSSNQSNANSNSSAESTSTTESPSVEKNSNNNKMAVKKKKNYWWLWLILAAALGYGYYRYREYHKKHIQRVQNKIQNSNLSHFTKVTRDK